MCLQLITAILAQQQQPLSTGSILLASLLRTCLMRVAAPVESIDAALRLVHAFGEGVSPSHYQQYVSEGSFPDLLAALHSTDVGKHASHPVVLSYFEVRVDDETVLHV